ncbi:MAG: hypothetical protein AABX04_00780 [Nanoarchaeota archaeon]
MGSWKKLFGEEETEEQRRELNRAKRDAYALKQQQKYREENQKYSEFLRTTDEVFDGSRAPSDAMQEQSLSLYTRLKEEDEGFKLTPEQEATVRTYVRNKVRYDKHYGVSDKIDIYSEATNDDPYASNGHYELSLKGDLTIADILCPRFWLTPSSIDRTVERMNHLFLRLNNEGLFNKPRKNNGLYITDPIVKYWTTMTVKGSKIERFVLTKYYQGPTEIPAGK